MSPAQKLLQQDEWDGAKVIDAMIVRGDLTMEGLTPEEIARFGPEAQSVLREQAAAKLATAPKLNPYPNHPAPPTRAERFMQQQIDRAAERRKKLDAANHWRISETDFNAQAIAKAEAKRARRKAARCHPPVEAAVERCVECNRPWPHAELCSGKRRASV